MRSFYQENLDQMRRPPQVRVRHVLIATPQGATQEQRQAARAEAEQVLQQVKAGADLGALAAQHSDDPGSRADGGLLPWLARGETVPAFDQAAFTLQKGQTSEVVETEYGFHVLRVEDQRPAATVPFEEARRQIENVLNRRKSRDIVRDRVAALRQQARVEVLF
jgi:parvulin-like peptidyl-prolyl isomerase